MKALSLLLSGALLLAPAMLPAVSQPAEPSDAQIAHVLNRLTFGPRPGDINKVRSLGIQQFINGQLNPTSLAESPIVVEQLKLTEAIRTASSSEMVGKFVMEQKRQKAFKLAQDGKGGKDGNGVADGNVKEMDRPTAGVMEAGTMETARARRMARMRGARANNATIANEQEGAGPRGKGRRFAQNGAQGNGAQGNGAQGNGIQGKGGQLNEFRRSVDAQLLDDKFARAVDSPRQLNELLCDFWFNHFNVCASKGVDRVLVGVYEEQAIRPHVMGNFRELLGATMHHPAMMFYLDNAQNTKVGYQTNNPKNKKKGINENYARELMELHTLGVDGGYTQQDVAELAKVLTGWGMPGLRDRNNGYWASFEERRHDFGDKVVLGKTIRGTGTDEIEQVLDTLAKHPSTAHHVSYQLAQFFVDDNPPASLVDKLSTTFTQSNGNIKSVLITMFDSPEFWDARYQSSKFKSPFLYTVSAYRATGQHVQESKQLQAFLKIQGQPLYACLTPDGYKNTKEAWLNADGLLKRIDFASRFAEPKRLEGNVDYQAVLGTINGGKISDKTQQAVANAPAYQKVAALISSPEFMRY